MPPRAEPVSFRTPSGAACRATVRRIAQPGPAILRAVLDPAAAAAAERDGAFHLADAARGADAGRDHRAPLTVDLRPGPRLAGQLPTPRTRLAEWFAADAARRDSDSWFATCLAQPGARPPWSSRTLWAYLDPSWAGDTEPGGTETGGVEPGGTETSSGDTETGAESGGTETGAEPGDTEPFGADAAGAIRGALEFLRAEHPDLLGDPESVERIVRHLLGGEPDPGRALDALTRVLTDAGAEPERLPDGSGLRVAMQGESGPWPCLVQQCSPGALVFYAIHPHAVPAEALDDAYRAIGRWNSDQLVGSLDLDPRSRRIVLRLPLLLDDRVPGEGLLRRALGSLLDEMDDAAALLDRIAPAVDGPADGPGVSPPARSRPPRS